MKIVDPTDPGVQTLNMLLYGPPGVGKSSCAATAPTPIIWLNAEGRGALRYAREMTGNDPALITEVEYENSTTLIEAYDHAKKFEYNTMVVDTIGEIHKQLLDEMVVTKKLDRASLQVFGDVNTKLERFCRALRALPLNVVLICHEQVEVDQSTGNMMKMPVTGGRQLPTILCAMADIVGYCGIQAGKDGKETYYTAFRSDGSKYGKDRSGKLGSFRKNNIARWIEVANGAVETTNPTVEVGA